MTEKRKVVVKVSPTSRFSDSFGETFCQGEGKTFVEAVGNLLLDFNLKFGDESERNEPIFECLYELARDRSDFATWFDFSTPEDSFKIEVTYES
jgi:hypothetical protein